MIPDLWYKNAIVYNIDLESFLDSDGDGVGDFGGLLSRLDYLQGLGIDTIWLAPFQPSPARDNGYDISDYYGVDERHGSSGDFVEFLHEARKRGIKVLMDLVANHTSDEHPWFRKSRSDSESKYRDWYIWSKKKPKGWDQGMVFPGFQEATWTRDAEAKAYYFHRFYEFQPDLNMENPEVRAEIRRVIGYWIELGIAGFRLDAVPFVIEKPHPGTAEHPQVFEYLYEFRDFLQWRQGNAILFGEANVLPKETRPYFGDRGNGLHMMFNFWVNQHMFHALAAEEVKTLATALRDTSRTPRMSQWGYFLRNHDELDLGRLEPEQQELVFAKFGPEEKMQIYDRGIRRRLAPMLGNRQHLELAWSLLFALPGTPVIYYGDEIGMGENLDLPQRESVRTPMQWSSERNAGFSTAEKLVHPVIDEGPYDYRRVNVADQKRDPSSLLRWMMRMIALRKECHEIGDGEWRILRTRSPHVLALRYDFEGETVVTFHNLSRRATEVSVRADDAGGSHLVSLLDLDDSREREGRHRLRIDAYGYHWFRTSHAYSLPMNKT
jgi:maltose alpha-D-glucosyltransferase / alpha-amylase